MSGIRRFRRHRVFSSRRDEVSRKFFVRDYLLVAGVLMVILGALLGARDYDIYLAGRPERISNSDFGTRYLPAIAPGDPGRRASAFAGFAVAGVGAALSAFALVMRVIAKRHTSKEQHV